MIQRIQSFFLVLAACCMALCFMTPLAGYTADKPETRQTANAELNLIAKDNPQMMSQMMNGAEVEYSQRVSNFKVWPLTALTIVVGLVALVSIFLYKNRILQMRVVAVGFLLNVALVFLIFFWAVDAYGKAFVLGMGIKGEADVSWMFGSFAPIISVVLLILAYRGIRKDEAKVRAADRLR